MMADRAAMVEAVARSMCRVHVSDCDALAYAGKPFRVGSKGYLAGPDPVPAWRLFEADAAMAVDAVEAAGGRLQGDAEAMLAKIRSTT